MALTRRLTWLILATAVAIAVVGAGLWALPEVLRRVAVTQIRAATGREASIGDVDLNVFTGKLAVKAFRLADRGRPEPFVQFERLDAGVRLLPLLAGRVRLAELSLHAPTVRLVRTGPAAFNFSDLLEPAPTPTKPRRAGLDLIVEHFRVVGGTVIGDDQAISPARTWKFDDLNVEGRDLSTRTGGNGGTVTVAVKLGETPISLRAEGIRLVPAAGHAALTVQGFDLSLLLPYLPPDVPASLKSGRFSATLTFDHGDAGTRVTGEAHFDQLVLLRRGQVPPFAALPRLTVAIQEATLVDRGVTVKKVELAGDASVLDASVSPPARLDLKGVRVTLEDAAWPARAPTPIQVVAGLPGNGRLQARGTVGLTPPAADLRVVLGAVDLRPFQPYVPIAARIGGSADAEVTVVASVDRELTATVRGRAGVSRLSLALEDRPVVEVARAEATGLAVAWPSRIAAARVLIRKPTATIERDERGQLPLRGLLAARGAASPAAAGAAPTGPAGGAPVPRKMAIDVGEIIVEDGYARFVDRTVSPPFSEEMSRIAVSLKGLSSAPGKRAQLIVQAIVGAAAALDLRGEVAPLGETLFVDLAGELREFTIPRVNPFMDRLLAWIARDGRLSTKVHYRIEGDRLQATNEIVIGRLELAQAGERDEVKRRIGLPLGLIVALMKDAHGEIRVSVPISGRLGAPEFSFGEAIWAAVKNVVLNILSAPFKLIGGLFTKGDTIEAATVDPLRFEPGSATPDPGMGEHLQRVREFLRASPYVRLALAPVVTSTDLASLKTQEVTARIQRVQREQGIAEFPAAAARVFKGQFPDRAMPATAEEIVSLLRDAEPEPDAAARALAARRIQAAREALVSPPDVQAERLPTAATPPSIGAPGDGRVEFSITQ